MNNHDITTLAPTAPTSAPTQWFAIHYAAEAPASLPRTIFANDVQTGDEGVLRFLVSPTDRPSRSVLEVAEALVVRYAAYTDLRSALADAFGPNQSTTAA